MRLSSVVFGCLLQHDSVVSIVWWPRFTALLLTLHVAVIFSSESRSRPGHAQTRSPTTRRPRTSPAADSSVNTALTGRRLRFPTQLLLHMNRYTTSVQAPPATNRQTRMSQKSKSGHIKINHATTSYSLLLLCHSVYRQKANSVE